MFDLTAVTKSKCNILKSETTEQLESQTYCSIIFKGVISGNNHVSKPLTGEELCFLQHQCSTDKNIWVSKLLFQKLGEKKEQEASVFWLSLN